MKKKFYTELAYVLGVIVLPLGCALMTYADFGISMVVAPAYLLHLKLSEIFPFFSFGTAEYTLQAALLLALVIVLRKFKWHYLFSVVTAVLYGVTLDGWLALIGLIPHDTLAVRIALFLAGMVACAVGVAFFFCTYISPEVYELFVVELSKKTGVANHKMKTIYDCVSCVISVIMSFAFFGFGHFEGVKFGTFICAVINGWMIGRCTAFIDRRFEFVDGLKLRKFFE